MTTQHMLASEWIHVVNLPYGSNKQCDSFSERRDSKDNRFVGRVQKFESGYRICVIYDVFEHALEYETKIEAMIAVDSILKKNGWSLPYGKLTNGNIPAGQPCPFEARCFLKNDKCPLIEKLKTNDFSCAAARMYVSIIESEERESEDFQKDL